MVCGDLPFLISHGFEAWLALFVGLVLGSIGLVQTLRFWLQRARARAEVRARTSRAATADQSIIRGNLIVGEASTFQHGEHAGRAVTHRSSELVVEQHGERIAILGDVVVQHGAAESTGWFRPPSTPHKGLVENAKTGYPMILRTVRQGDEIIVCGARSAEAARSDEGGYRASGGMRAITAGKTPVTICAARPAGRPAALGLAWTGPIIAFTVAWFLALRWVGQLAEARMGGEGWLSESPRNLSAAAIAAAIPTSRDHALRHLEGVLSSPRTEASLRFALGFAAFQGTCPAALLRRRGLFDEAVALARQCGSPRALATELAFAGRFDEAATILVSDPHRYLYDVTTTVSIATGRWADAAIAVETSRKTKAACLGALFRTFAGDTGALVRLRQAHATSELPATCLLMETLALPQGERRVAIEQLADKGKEIEPPGVLQALLAVAGDGLPTSMLDESRLTRGVKATSWVAPFALAAYGGSDSKYSTLR